MGKLRSRAFEALFTDTENFANEGKEDPRVEKLQRQPDEDDCSHDCKV